MNKLIFLLFFLFTSNLFAHEDDSVVVGCSLESAKDFTLDKDKQEYVPLGYDPNDFNYLVLEIYFVGEQGIEFEHTMYSTPRCKKYKGHVKANKYFASCHGDFESNDFDGELFSQNYFELDRFSGKYEITYVERENKKYTYWREFGGVCKKLDRKF